MGTWDIDNCSASRNSQMINFWHFVKIFFIGSKLFRIGHRPISNVDRCNKKRSPQFQERLSLLVQFRLWIVEHDASLCLHESPVRSFRYSILLRGIGSCRFMLDSFLGKPFVEPLSFILFAHISSEDFDLSSILTFCGCAKFDK